MNSSSTVSFHFKTKTLMTYAFINCCLLGPGAFNTLKSQSKVQTHDDNPCTHNCKVPKPWEGLHIHRKKTSLTRFTKYLQRQIKENKIAHFTKKKKKKLFETEFTAQRIQSWNKCRKAAFWLVPRYSISESIFKVFYPILPSPPVTFRNKCK